MLRRMAPKSEMDLRPLDELLVVVVFLVVVEFAVVVVPVLVLLEFGATEEGVVVTVELGTVVVELDEEDDEVGGVVGTIASIDKLSIPYTYVMLSSLLFISLAILS